MNTKLFSEAMSEVSDKYYMEAADYQPECKKHNWVKYGISAACFAVLLAAASSLITNYFKRQSDIRPDNPIDISAAGHDDTEDSDTAASFDNAMPSEISEIHINMSGIFINELDALADTAKLNFEDAEAVTWNKDDMIAYYGMDLTPAYIPAGLFAAPRNDTATVWVGQDGKLVEDTICLEFYSGFYEDDSPKLTENVSAVQGFSITASKLGIVSDCIYLLPENEVKISDIGGTAVTFGYRSMPYGPYDPETHEPSGYYDMYVAEFECEGIEYMIIAEQMEMEELVKVAASIIYGEEEITIYQ